MAVYQQGHLEGEDGTEKRMFVDGVGSLCGHLMGREFAPAQTIIMQIRLVDVLRLDQLDLVYRGIYGGW